MKYLNSIPSPEYIRTKLKTIEKLAFTFDDGVKLVIEGATPDILADFYMYQGIDVNARSDDALPDAVEWFKMRGCKTKLAVDERVRKYSQLWFFDKFKIFVFKHMFL